MAGPTPLIVFDFDHTLTDRETLSRFLLTQLPFWRVLRAVLWIPLLLPLYGFQFGCREGFKRAVLRGFLSGLPSSDYVSRAQKYASRHLPQFLRADRKQLLRSYIEAGEEVWLVSGSLHAYLAPLAQSLGIRVVLACEMAINRQGKLTGHLRGGNCWGPEKLRRLRHLEPLAERPLVMYGDSQGDRDLLAAAWEAHLLDK